MIRLNADTKYPPLPHRIAAPTHIPDLGGCKYEILVAHQLGHGCGDYRDDGPLQILEHGFPGSVVQNELSEFAHGHAADRAKHLLIERLEKQTGDIIVFWIDQRLAHDFV